MAQSIIEHDVDAGVDFNDMDAFGSSYHYLSHSHSYHHVQVAQGEDTLYDLARAQRR